MNLYYSVCWVELQNVYPYRDINKNKILSKDYLKDKLILGYLI